MKKNVENKIITIACILTGLLVIVFTLSQGVTKFSGEDEYNGSSEVSEVEVSNPYSIISTDKKEDKVTAIVYSKEELSDDSIVELVDEVKNTSELKDGSCKIYVFNNEENANSGKVEDAAFTITYSKEDGIIIEKYYEDVEHELSKEKPEYSLISVENVKDEKANDGSLLTQIKVVMDGNDSQGNMLGKIKYVGNHTREIANTLSILEIIAYTSEDKNEYWIYNGHSKNAIKYVKEI